MKIWFQIYTGNVHQLSGADADQVLQKIRPFFDAGKLGGVLAGWGIDPAFYERLSQTLHEWEIQFFFKTAAFSEIEEAPAYLKAPFGYDPMLDKNGNEVPKFVLNEQEQFLFRCPSSANNLQLARDYMDTFLSQFSFDGVFFDRIRMSSLIAGIPGIGCFCDSCRRYYRRAGINIDNLRTALSKAEASNDLGLLEYRDGTWKVSDPDMNRFFEVRCDLITNAVASLAGDLHKRGYKVGLDLFAPMFGYFAGQDVLRLSGEVDFIKPMVYRFTDAPAGLVFEKRALEAVSRVQCPGVDELFSKELEVLQKAKCAVYPGIDMNVIDPICHPEREDIQETLAMLKERGYDEMVAAWNLMCIPEEYLSLMLNA